MRGTAIGRVIAALILGVTGALVHAKLATGSNLYVNGSLASSRMIEHGGIAYVPVTDIAKAMNMAVAPKADGLSMALDGGGDPLKGINGNIGEKLTSGGWNMTVVKVFRTDKYVHQFDTDTSTPSSPTDDVVIVVLRIKNAHPESVGISLPGSGSTSVTDNDEHSYRPLTFGGADDLHGYPTMLPGSAVDFALCFGVPKTAKLGDFVYQVRPAGDKPPTFRVSLASVNL